MPEKIFTIVDALHSLVPTALWVIRGEGDLGGYADLEWYSENITQPSEESVLQEVQRLQEEYDALRYQRVRAENYPDFKEFLDGWVKQDEQQLEAYRAACLEVKNTYPKPEAK